MDLLIDADILACQFAYAYEASRSRSATYDGDGDVDIDDAGWAIEGFHSAVERMMGETELRTLFYVSPVQVILGIQYYLHTSQTAGGNQNRCFWILLLNMLGIPGIAKRWITLRQTM